MTTKSRQRIYGASIRASAQRAKEARKEYELVVLTSGDYSELILAESTIEEHLAHWRARGNVGDITRVKGYDAVTVIRRALAKCPDEYPPSPTTELLFITSFPLQPETPYQGKPQTGSSLLCWAPWSEASARAAGLA